MHLPTLRVHVLATLKNLNHAPHSRTEGKSVRDENEGKMKKKIIQFKNLYDVCVLK